LAQSEQLAAGGYVIARVVGLHEDAGDPQQIVTRGRLREAIDGAVEIALALRGALPPAVDVAADTDVTTRDQLFRVRTLDAPGLCLVLPPLAKLADEDGVLDAGDSLVLATWRALSATQALDVPVALLFERADRALSMLAPQPLGELFDAPETAAPIAPPSTPEAPPSTRPLSRQLSRQLSRPMSRQGTTRGPIIATDPLAGLDLFDEDDFFAEQASLPFDERQTATAVHAAPVVESTCTLGVPDHLAGHIDALRRAEGPKPVRAIEQLFCEHYTPLLDAIGGGCEHRSVIDAVTTWRKSFEKSYTESYTAMRVTGRRPTMVLDAPDITTRIARANGARSVQLLLVDSMRFDLGRRVTSRLAERLGNRAVCVDETLLWSALPTLTPTQIHLLSRGPRGLREKGEERPERGGLVHRGRSVTTLRRIRIGQRDLIKLDVVEARLREAGPGYAERLHGLANEVSAIIERFAESLAPRTLLTVFGDHGFRLSPGSMSGTGPAEQGGASPEEVLVPSHSWLIGDVH
jgi:hypothetical protein